MQRTQGLYWSRELSQNRGGFRQDLQEKRNRMSEKEIPFKENQLFDPSVDIKNDPGKMYRKCP